MKTLNKTLAKGALGTVAAGAMALASATPAMADDRKRGVDAGDVIAGALIIGGIAAAAGVFDGDKDDRRYRDRDYRGYDNGYDRGYGYRGSHPDRAIQRCVTAVEREAKRNGYRFARVTQIRDVDRERRGWEVEGRIEVGGAYGYDRGGYGYNNRGYDNRGYDNRGYGYGNRGRGRDEGKFRCDIRRGQIVDIDFSGIRGLR